MAEMKPTAEPHEVQDNSKLLYARALLLQFVEIAGPSCLSHQPPACHLLAATAKYAQIRDHVKLF